MAPPRKSKREVATAVHQQHVTEQPAPRQHSIPSDVPESFVRFAVIAHRNAGPLHTVLMDLAMRLPTQPDAVAKQTREEMRQLLDRMEDA